MFLKFHTVMVGFSGPLKAVNDEKTSKPSQNQLTTILHLC